MAAPRCTFGGLNNTRVSWFTEYDTWYVVACHLAQVHGAAVSILKSPLLLLVKKALFSAVSGTAPWAHRRPQRPAIFHAVDRERSPGVVLPGDERRYRLNIAND